MAIQVPGCGGNRLLQTDNIVRLDFQGYVFAYLVSGARVHRDETGHLRDLGSVAYAIWYDENGDGRFRSVIWTPVLPPPVPPWARRHSVPQERQKQ